MPLIEDSFAALTDLKILLGDIDNVGCHLFIFSPRTRQRREEWLQIAVDDVVAKKLVESTRRSLLTLEERAADDQALHEFDFDAMSDNSIGVLKLDDVGELTRWLNDVPENDWPVRFNGDERTLDKVRFFVVRLSFPDGKIIKLFRGSRGITVSLQAKGFISAAFSRRTNEMIAIEGPVISIDGKFDFVEWNDYLFISNLLTFESITNIREVTVRKANEVVDVLSRKLHLGDNVDALKFEIGKRTRLAKRLAAAQKHGLIDDIDLQSLVDRAAEKGLRLRCTMQDGVAKFDINCDNAGEVADFVDLITDIFLFSPVTKREWEAVVKRPPRSRR